MPAADGDADTGRSPRATTPPAEAPEPDPRRVLLRPEPGESKEEFAARLLAAVTDNRRGSPPDG